VFNESKVHSKDIQKISISNKCPSKLYIYQIILKKCRTVSTKIVKLFTSQILTCPVNTNGNVKGFPWLEIKTFMLFTVIAHSKNLSGCYGKILDYKTAIKYSCKLYYYKKHVKFIKENIQVKIHLHFQYITLNLHLTGRHGTQNCLYIG